MAVAVFLTSCEQDSILEDEVQELLAVESDSEVTTFYSLSDLPENLPTPNKVLEQSMESLGEEDLDSRDCIDVIRYKVNGCNDMIVDWNSENNLALFVYHYKVAGNEWLGTTRINPTNQYCNFRCDGFGFCPSGNNGQIRSVAFMGSGSTTYDSITKYWTDN